MGSWSNYFYRLSYGAKGTTEYTNFNTGIGSADTELKSCHDHRVLTANAHGLVFTGPGAGGGLDADKLDGYHAYEISGAAGSADYATEAGSASEAYYATNAGSASEASYTTSASSADYATLSSSADYATLASSADYATNSSSADYATVAGSADDADTLDGYHANSFVMSGGTSQLFLSAAGGWPATTSGCALNSKTELTTNKVNIYTLDFDKAAIEYAEWTAAMPSNWDASTITAVFYWMHTTATSAGVVWGLQGRAYTNDDALDQAMGTAQEVTDTGGTANDLYISSVTSAITLAGSPAANQLVQFRAYRDATDGSDTLDVDARLLGIMITYGKI